MCIIKSNSCVFTTGNQVISSNTNIYRIHFILWFCIYKQENNTVYNAIEKSFAHTVYKFGKLFSVRIAHINNSAGTGGIEDFVEDWIESAAHNWHRTIYPRLERVFKLASLAVSNLQNIM